LIGKEEMSVFYKLGGDRFYIEVIVIFL